MDRTIKFRAWDDKNKKWLLGYEYPNLGGFDMFGETMAFGEWTGVLSSFALEDWKYIMLMQYTGLKDKRGKQIYEGDILNWDNNKKKYTMGFENGSFDIIDFDSYGHDQSRAFEDETEWEVIGNIYENPDLLFTSIEEDKCICEIGHPYNNLACPVHGKISN